MPIRFLFNELKATQAAGLLLSLAGGRMMRLRLIKLLYLAEREHLRDAGRPIVGDYYVSMRHGPVLSNVLDLAEEDDRLPGAVWRGYIRRDGEHGVRLVQDPGQDQLSRAEVETLRRVHREQRSRTRWEIRDMTHLFPEWQDPGPSSVPIFVEDILSALGKTAREIQRIASATQERHHFDRLFRARA